MDGSGPQQAMSKEIDNDRLLAAATQSKPKHSDTATGSEMSKTERKKLMKTTRERRQMHSLPVIKHVAKDVNDIKFTNIGNNMLTIWHRPKLAHFHHLKELIGITCIVTCQAIREIPEDIQQGCSLAGITWVYVEMNGANKPLLKRKEILTVVATGLHKVMLLMNESNHKILVHCAAGIHRTGTFAYSLLRLNGFSSEESMNKLKEMREVTYKEVGQWRIELAENSILPAYQKIYSREARHEDHKECDNAKKETVSSKKVPDVTQKETNDTKKETADDDKMKVNKNEL